MTKQLELQMMQRNWKNGPKLSHCEAKEIRKLSHFDIIATYGQTIRGIPNCFLLSSLTSTQSCLSHLAILREREREREREIANPPTSQIWKNINSPDSELNPKVQFFLFLQWPTFDWSINGKILKRKKKSLKLLVIHFWVH